MSESPLFLPPQPRAETQVAESDSEGCTWITDKKTKATCGATVTSEVRVGTLVPILARLCRTHNAEYNTIQAAHRTSR